ncbi:MAG TPA: hypothetical protein VLV76_28950 [Candidatus Acidoferrum sp.]|nr:hypothetical protein [Candidatus Acidoferrum sp.]
MDQDLFWLRNETEASNEQQAPARRASRPMTRVQEIALLSVAFGFGAALQLAYVLHGALTP